MPQMDFVAMDLMIALEAASTFLVIPICVRVVPSPQPAHLQQVLLLYQPLNQLLHASQDIVDWEPERDHLEHVVPTIGIAIKCAMEMVDAPIATMAHG